MRCRPTNSNGLFFAPRLSVVLPIAYYTAFIHLLGSADPETGNTIWAQVDREPCFQSYPTSWWQEGEIIRDTYTLVINPETPSGTYEMMMGFYHWPELTRLNSVESTHKTDNQAVILQSIEILP